VAAFLESSLQRSETWALLWMCMALPFSGKLGGVHVWTRASRPPPHMQIAAFALAVAVTAAFAWYAAQPVVAEVWLQRGVQFEAAGD